MRVVAVQAVPEVRVSDAGGSGAGCCVDSALLFDACWGKCNRESVTHIKCHPGK